MVSRRDTVCIDHVSIAMKSGLTALEYQSELLLRAEYNGPFLFIPYSGKLKGVSWLGQASLSFRHSRYPVWPCNATAVAVHTCRGRPISTVEILTGQPYGVNQGKHTTEPGFCNMLIFGWLDMFQNGCFYTWKCWTPP